MRHALLVAPLVFLAGAAVAAPRTFPLVVADGVTAGQVTVTDAPKGVVVRVDAQGLPPGWHGMHFHSVATCADAGFKASGGHVHAAAVTAPVHGLLNPAATDGGDLPNLYVAADGSAHAEFFSPFVSTEGAGGRLALYDADGSALVIHAAPDDYLSQPIGGAGARIACSAIK